MSVHVFLILGLGGMTGILSGMFGVGGGFLMTPLLIFIGVPPTVAVATSANQIVAASVSGFSTHWKLKNVDFKMGNLLLLGGLFGSTLGIWLFNWLKGLGQIDLVISLSYVLFLGGIGSLMAIESSRAILKIRKPVSSKQQSKLYLLAHRLPFRTRFTRSKLHISAILPITLGLLVGALVSIMGIGGGFFMLPAMIYLLGMPTAVVIGTSLYQIIFITANVTILHAISTQTVDIILALLLLVGSVIGAQFGTRLGAKLPAEQLRGLLAATVLAVALKLAYGLFVTPQDVYSISVEKVR